MTIALLFASKAINELNARLPNFIMRYLRTPHNPRYMNNARFDFISLDHDYMAIDRATKVTDR